MTLSLPTSDQKLPDLSQLGKALARVAGPLRDRQPDAKQVLDRPVALPGARIDQRLIAPLRRSPRATAAFAGALFAVLAAHGVLLVFLFTRDRSAEPLSPKEPTPVEVVVEQKPPPPLPKRPDPPKPQPKQEIEKPASSAPRAPSDQKVDTAAVDKETHAPKAPVPPSEGRPEPKPDAASPSTDPAKVAEPEDAAKPDVLQKDAEALDKAQLKEKPKKIAKAAPKARQRKPMTALQQLAGASNLPDYRFARPTKKSPVTGGTEDARYLAIVYGMIMQNRRPIPLPAAIEGSVTVVFSVDDAGNVISIGLQRGSGYPDVDAEIAQAVRRASPFPPPPPGAPHGLVATIDFGDMKPAYTMGSRGR